MNPRLSIGIRRVTTIAFVVLAGSFVGAYLFSEFIHNETVSAHQSIATRFDSGAFRPSENCPGFSIVDSLGARNDFLTHFSDSTVLLAFLSGSCLPCNEFVDFVRYELGLQQRHYCVVLVSQYPAVYRANSPVPVYGISEEELNSLGIDTYPTIIGKADNNEIKFAHAGFRMMITSEYIDSLLLY